MVEHPDKEEIFITDHPDSKLMIVAMDYRPMAEIIYYKKGIENEILNFEEFISIKGINALGNQLSKEKIRDINLLDPLPSEEPEVDQVEVVEEEIVDNSEIEADQTDDKEENSKASVKEEAKEKPVKPKKKSKGKDDNASDNQITLF
jgi:topoisomerase-4 subunit A